MPYAPIDDRFDDHPKYVRLKLGLQHLGLMACAITYCTRNLTDGVIPRTWPGRRFGASGAQLARSLVAHSVWCVRSDGDYEILGFLEHNPSRADVEAKRDAKSKAGKLGGKASAQARASAPAPAGRSSRPPELLQPTTSPLHSTTEIREERSTPSALLSTGLGAPVEPATPLADEVHRDRAREQITRLAEWAKANGVDR